MHSILDIAFEINKDLVVCNLDTIGNTEKLYDQIKLWKKKNCFVLVYAIDNFVHYTDYMCMIRDSYENFAYTTPGKHNDSKHIPNVDYLSRFTCDKSQIRIDHYREKKYKFLFLVGKLHPHRLKLLASLSENNLMSESLLSMRNYNLAYQHLLPEKVILPTKYEWSDLAKLGVFEPNDPPDSKIMNAWVNHMGLIHPARYQDTAYSIVSETNIDPGINYITEKTWIPLAAEHILISHGNRGNNQFLEELGFKITNSVIKNYNETDHQQVTDLCVELNSHSYRSVYKDTEEQRAHNRYLCLDEQRWRKYHASQLQKINFFC